MGTIEILAVLFTAVVIGVWSCCESGAPRPYRDRSCEGKEWRRGFPTAPKDAIRKFLDCFVDAMAFADSTRLKFRPSDRVLEVYRSIYGGRVPFGDDMECERFVMNLSEQFDVPISEIEGYFYEQIALGELFSKVAMDPNA